jgi:hypothetical protein
MRKKIINFIWSEKFILLLIIFLALVLRLNNLEYLNSSPVPLFASEATPINTALRLLESQSLNANILGNNYQPVLIYANVFLYAFTFVLSLLTGIFHSVEDLKIFFILDRAPLVLLSRFLIVAASTASVYYLYKAAKRLFNGTVGLIAGFFFAIELSHVATSHLAAIWTPMLLFLILSFDQAVEVLKGGQKRAYFLSVLFAVLSYASHLIGGIAIIPLIAAHFLKHKKITKNVIFSGILFIFSIVLLFFIDRMGVMWEFGTKSFLIETCPFFNNYSDAFFYPLKFIFNFHPVLAVLGAISIVFLVICKKYKEIILILPLPVFYYLYLGPFSFTGCQIRFFTIFMPFLAVLSAVAIVYAVDAINIKLVNLKKLLLAILTVLIAVPSLYIVFSWSLLIGQKSTDEQAQQWITESLPGDSKILIEQVNGRGRVFIEKNKENISFIKEKLGEGALTERQKFILNLPEGKCPSPAYFVVTTDMVAEDGMKEFFRKFKFDYYIFIGGKSDTSKSEKGKLIKSFEPDNELDIDNLLTDVYEPFKMLPKFHNTHGNVIKIYKLNN